MRVLVFVCAPLHTTPLAHVPPHIRMHPLVFMQAHVLCPRILVRPLVFPRPLVFVRPLGEPLACPVLFVCLSHAPSACTSPHHMPHSL
jgi:hypothetical protein